MSKVVLVNPSLSVDSRYGVMSVAGGVEIPFGICYLAGYLKEKKVSVQIIDACALNLDSDGLIGQIKKTNCRYLGITVTTQQLPSAAAVAEKLKKENPELIIIVGGCHISSSYEETLRQNPFFDYAVVGEGEVTLFELIKALDNGQDLAQVPGVVFRQKGNIVFSGQRERIKDIDLLPLPAFDLLSDIRKYYRLTIQNVIFHPGVSIITSRGCFGKCVFCDRSVFGNCLTSHSPEYILRMITSLVDSYGIKSVMFQDDNFFLPKARLFKFCDLLAASGLDLKWSASSRIDAVSEELLIKIKQSGCWQISYGIESANQEILKFYNKKIEPEQIRKVLSMTKRCGILTKGFFIFGGPKESEESLAESIEFMLNADLDDVSVTFFTPYPGIEIYKTISSYGSFDADYQKMSCFDIVFVPFGLTKEKLLYYQAKALKLFYFRIPVIFSYLKRIRSFSFFLRLSASSLALLLNFFKKNERLRKAVNN
ncbi:MAG: radical SAM protein [Candidatus Omnitrophica bacterium]|nr:radical SAM protein [Candidatus Omnitrophota bacterium]